MNESTFPTTESLKYTYGGPLSSAILKKNPSDFEVEEVLHYELTGEGEHLYLFIEKEGLNTQEVKSLLSKQFGVPLGTISEAGLKDKNALTRQWLSVHWPIKKELPDFDQFTEFKILKHTRHIKKLKKGAFGFNKFKLVLREIHASMDEVNNKLDQIANRGFANYFGPQRFGFNQSNLENAVRLFEGRRLKRQARSMALSAARSFLFNQLLSMLIDQRGWPLNDVTHGILWGKANKGHKDEIKDIANVLSSQYTQLCEGLESFGVDQCYRLLSVVPEEYSWHWLNDNTLEIKFNLPPGSFATGMLREVFNLEEQVCES